MCRYSEENMAYQEIMDYWWDVYTGKLGGGERVLTGVGLIYGASNAEKPVSVSNCSTVRNMVCMPWVGHPERYVRYACLASGVTCCLHATLQTGLFPQTLLEPLAGDKHVPAVMKAGHTPAEVGEEESDEDMFAPPTPGAPVDRAMSGALPAALAVTAA